MECSCDLLYVDVLGSTTEEKANPSHAVRSSCLGGCSPEERAAVTALLLPLPGKEPGSHIIISVSVFSLTRVTAGAPETMQ